MYCKKCGTLNSDNAIQCVKCGEVLQPIAATPQKIPNYLVQAIIVTALCCIPFGIPAIVYAAQVNGKIQAGDYQGALESSRKAKMWSWIAFGCGLAFGIIYLAFAMLGALAGAHH